MGGRRSDDGRTFQRLGPDRGGVHVGDRDGGRITNRRHHTVEADQVGKVGFLGLPGGLGLKELKLSLAHCHRGLQRVRADRGSGKQLLPGDLQLLLRALDGRVGHPLEIDRRKRVEERLLGKKGHLKLLVYQRRVRAGRARIHLPAGKHALQAVEQGERRGHTN